MASQDETTTTTDPTSLLSDPSVADGAPAEPAATGAAPARRRATKKASAPAPAPDEAPAGEPTQPPARKTARRTTKKAAAPTDEGAAAAVAVSATEDPTEAGEEVPTATKRAPRKSAAKSAAKTARKPTQSAARKAAAALAAEPVTAPAAVDPDDQGHDTADDAADAKADRTQPEAVAATPDVPASFGLLFQAPDPAVAPARRRATRPASPPVVVEDTEPQATPSIEPAPADETRPAARRSRRSSQAAGRPDPTAEAAPANASPAPGDPDGSADGGRDGSRHGSAEATPGDRTGLTGAGDAHDVADPHGADHAADHSDDHADDHSDDHGDAGETADGTRRRRRRGGKGRRGRGGDDANGEHGEDAADGSGGHPATDAPADDDAEEAGTRRRRRRRRSGSGSGDSDDPPGTVTRVRQPRARDEVTGLKGSTRLEAKKQRRREGREAGRRRTIITEAEFLARRESVERVMVVRGTEERTQIAVLEDDVLVEHYVSKETSVSMAGNIYLGRVQNVLPSMEAAFVDIGKGRNAVLYAGEVNWDAAGLEGNAPKRIENALKSGDSVLVQVTKDPIGHKGARLTSQISLPGRFLVYVPEGSMTGISRKLPDTERARLKAILKEVVPQHAGVIVRTAAEGASEEELRADVERLTTAWDRISTKAEAAMKKKGSAGGAPVLLHGEPDLTVRVIRDIFNEDFASLVVAGEQSWQDVQDYVASVAPDLQDRITRWTGEGDVFVAHRVDEQIAKAMDRKVWLPSGGSLVIDRTEAMTVVDVNTGKFVGSGGNLEETVTKNNIEAAEEIVRQLRLRDIGGIIVIDFIDMVLESNRELVVRRLLECLGRDRTKHQVAEVTSLGLVQMTRKRVGSGLIEVFSEPCEHCAGRGIIIHTEPVDKSGSGDGGHSSGHGQGGGSGSGSGRGPGRRGRGSSGSSSGSGEQPAPAPAAAPEAPAGPTAAQIAAAAHAAALKASLPVPDDAADATVPDATGPDATGPDATVPDPSTRAEPRPTQQTEPQQAPEPAQQPEPAQAAPVSAAPARSRRRRGRVVAPAGPPRHADSTAAQE